MPQNLYPHRIEHTKNKHSRAVYRDDTIVIRLARNLTEEERREHVVDLLGRMTKQLIREESRRIGVHPFKKLLSGSENDLLTLANGTTYVIALQPGTTLGAKRTPEGWNVSVGPRVRRAQLHRFLWNLLSGAEEKRIRTAAEEINAQTLQMPLRHLRLRFASSQWGSCSPKESIMLNAALLFLPRHLLRYVTIHELAHRRHHDHSSAFWDLVRQAMPDYRAARAELQTYRLPRL